MNKRNLTEPRDFFHAYPRELKASTLRSDQRGSRDRSYFALHGGAKVPVELPVVWSSTGDRITVFEGDPHLFGSELDSQQLRPVYRFPPNGPPLVPTGLLFARFEEGTVVEDRDQQITDAGFQVVSVPKYAPHSAWLKASDGQACSALSRIERLEALADMVNVEPQLLGPRVQR